MKILVLPRKTVAQVREDVASTAFYRNPEFFTQREQQQQTGGGPTRFRFEERANCLGSLERISAKGEISTDAEAPSWRVRRFLQEEEAAALTEAIYFEERSSRVEAIRSDRETLEERVRQRLGASATETDFLRPALFRWADNTL
jgi:hypothetical protein